MTRWTRWWPLTGIAFVGLFIGGFAVTGNSPDSTSTDAKILSYYARNSNQRKEIAALLMILGACLLFVWFAAMLRNLLARVEGTGPLAALAYGSSIAAAALWLASDALFRGPALAANDTSKFHLDPNTFRIFNDAGYAVWFSGTTIASGLIAATALVALRTGLLPRWLAWLSLVAALTLLVSFFFIPFFILLGWILVVSVTLMLRKEAPATVAPPA